MAVEFILGYLFLYLFCKLLVYTFEENNKINEHFYKLRHRY